MGMMLWLFTILGIGARYFDLVFCSFVLKVLRLGDALRQGLRRYRRGLGSLGRRPEPRRRKASPGEG